MRHFRYSFIITALCLGFAAYWGYVLAGIGNIWPVLSITLILGVMEVSLSFDNAVVNASVLKEMDARWRIWFLTVGILIAVFGMRLLFPVLIVAVATGESLHVVAQLALHQPDLYSQHLHGSHTAIAAFGGTFLFMVFLDFILDEGKELHWLGVMEEKMAKLGKIESIEVVIALMVLIGLQHYLPLVPAQKLTMLLSGITGLVLYVLIGSIDGLFEQTNANNIKVSAVAKRSGVFGFLYLEVLDASFSFDGVIGAFAITRDVVIIMLGLAIGALFIRSLTVYLVEKGTLDEYVYIEHGAHYAIGILALIMFYSIYQDVPELFTGLVGISFILASLVSSILHKRAQRA